jgi:hypothetical protein
MGKTEYISDPVCIEEIIDVDLSTHPAKITAVLGSVRPIG